MPYGARLLARPSTVTASAPAGLHPLRTSSERDSYLYVPPHYRPERRAPLVLLLHGAGGHAHHGLDLLRHLADENGLILVAPASNAHTWDIIVNSSYGVDVANIDQALQQAFASYAIDPAHVAIAGFSDGASYALSLGLANGDLFTHVIAFSPGFAAPAEAHGKPRIFISHGIADNVLPIGPCSREIVPRLAQSGYQVAYHEFDGGHVIPSEIAQEAVRWMLADERSA
ncbi:alpha/beta hydrolase [Noviherbaspirillum massiliense]|uniref:alpha/beta hydrolase n=1 Tax=Noviherbaspirillum massiliense TaxID=1465823 RepID=UPI0002DF5B16|nr:alpha/beta hydrolase-fold protein [Noviherbaspirillum massiliense]